MPIYFGWMITKTRAELRKGTFFVAFFWVGSHNILFKTKLQIICNLVMKLNVMDCCNCFLCVL